MTKVVIAIWRGMVQSVHADEEVNVVIVDFDTRNPDEEPYIKKRFDRELWGLEPREYTQIPS